MCEQVGAEASGEETDFTFLDSLYFFAEKVVQVSFGFLPIAFAFLEVFFI